jgi:CubicO group peptidase (beta-lactamase class C family)
MLRILPLRWWFVQRRSVATTAQVPASPLGQGRSMAFWHTGFTGVSLWIDPDRELVAILLTNRIHPTRENQQIYDLRPEFHRAVNAAVIGAENPSTSVSQ